MKAKLHAFGALFVDFLIFHIQLTFVITMIQTMGAHFRYARDPLGLFPRFWQNLVSPSTLLGDGAFGRLGEHVRFIWRFWSGWILGLVRSVIWVWPASLLRGFWLVAVRGVTISRERIAGNVWSEHSIEVAHNMGEEVRRKYKQVVKKVVNKVAKVVEP
jgi:hypothetical protein